MKQMLLLLSVLVCTSVLSAQTPQDRAGLLNGDAMDQAMVAEANGYPGPMRVLEVAAKLQLTDQQKKAVSQIGQEMEVRAREVGQRIIHLEEELNKAFQDQLVIEKSVRDDAEQIGRLRGRLRAVFLVAHLKTRAVLTDKQLSIYASLAKPEKEKR